MNSLFCFAYVHSFYFTCETVFILNHEFSHFYHPDSLYHPTGGGVNKQLGLNHNNMKEKT